MKISHGNDSSSAAIWNSITDSASLQHLVNNSRVESIISWLSPGWFLVLSVSSTSVIKLLWTSNVTNFDHWLSSFIPQSTSVKPGFLSSVLAWLDRANNLRKNNTAIMTLSDGALFEKALYKFNSLIFPFCTPTLFPISRSLTWAGISSWLQSLCHMTAVHNLQTFASVADIQWAPGWYIITEFL